MSMRKSLSTRGICTILALLAVGFGAGQTRLLAQVAPNQKMSDDTTAGSKTPAGSGAASASSNSAPATDPNKLNAEILKELEQMRLRIQELEAQLRAQQGPAAPAAMADASESSSR